MATRLDFVIFGATGFTGQCTVRELVRLSAEKPCTWGVSGRNKAKLKTVLEKVGTQVGKDLSSTEVIIADVDDAKALEAMAARAKVVINCCGPYHLWGEPVVKACIASGASHVDISGEPRYIEQIQLKYHETACQEGVYIVSACGFDCIPSDLGLVFLQQQFKGVLNSVESYIYSKDESGEPGPIVNSGTYESAIQACSQKGELANLFRKLFPSAQHAMSPVLKSRGLLFRSNVIHKWCMPFLGADREVMLRSQRYFHEAESKRPAQAHAYVAMPGPIIAMGMIMIIPIFVLLCQFRYTRSLLLKHPKFFTAGYASRQGPSEKKANGFVFAFTLAGEGWDEHSAEPTGHHDDPPNKRMTVKVSGRNPGYGATCTALILSAFMILKESDKMPGNGGVYSPGAAFAKTSLISELDKNGLKFEVIA